MTRYEVEETLDILNRQMECYSKVPPAMKKRAASLERLIQKMKREAEEAGA